MRKNKENVFGTTKAMLIETEGKDQLHILTKNDWFVEVFLAWNFGNSHHWWNAMHQTFPCHSRVGRQRKDAVNEITATYNRAIDEISTTST